MSSETTMIGIFAVLIGILVGGTIGLLIGAVILRAAISLCNKFSGTDSSSGVPEPPMGKAMLIVLVATIVNLVVNFVVGFMIGVAGMASGSSAMQTVQGLAALISLPVGFFTQSGIIAAMLPTSFTRGMLVTLCHYLIVFLIAIVIFALVAVFAGALIFNRH